MCENVTKQSRVGEREEGEIKLKSSSSLPGGLRYIIETVEAQFSSNSFWPEEVFPPKRRSCFALSVHTRKWCALPGNS